MENIRSRTEPMTVAKLNIRYYILQIPEWVQQLVWQVYFSGDKNNTKVVVANYKHCEKIIIARWRILEVGRSQWRWQSRKRRCWAGRWGVGWSPQGPVDDDGENYADDEKSGKVENKNAEEDAGKKTRFLGVLCMSMMMLVMVMVTLMLMLMMKRRIRIVAK